MSSRDLQRWDPGPNYIGERYRNYYVVVSQHRDSSAIERANFQAACARLPEDGDNVVIVCSRHWAVGWVEQLLVHQDASEPIWQIAEKIHKDLERYPVLDEQLLGELEEQEIQTLWEAFSEAKRKAFLARFDLDPKLADATYSDVMQADLVGDLRMHLRDLLT